MAGRRLLNPYKAFVLAAVAASFWLPANTSGAQGLSPDMSLAVVMATLRTCGAHYADMQPAIGSARNAWRERNAAYAARLEKNADWKAAVDDLVEIARRKNERPDRAVCRELVESLADPARDAEIKTLFAPQ